MTEAHFDLSDPASAYVFGFIQADGHHSAGKGRKGRISVEIKAEDVQLLRDMQPVLPWRTSITFRTRITNFSSSAYNTAVLGLCMLEGRARFLELGLPVGRKSAIIAPPTEPFSHSDYLRGVIDADGSVGFTAKGWPFISLVTASPAIAEFTCAEILRITGAVRTARPNARDGVMNVMIASDPATKFARWLYEGACIGLERKREAALTIANWERPAGMRAWSKRKRWTPAEDAVILRMSLEDAAKILGRTEKSVHMRRWRLEAKPRSDPQASGEPAAPDGPSDRLAASDEKPSRLPDPLIVTTVSKRTPQLSPPRAPARVFSAPESDPASSMPRRRPLPCRPGHHRGA
jgi:hypothetical protein